MRYDPTIEIADCEGVYAPHDDTFLLLDCVRDVEGKKVLEMGCGTGIISIHCAKAGASVTAVDVNPGALECTRVNARSNHLSIQVIESDLFSAITDDFDLIIFNPPYLPVSEDGELERAWAGGEGGLEVVERFLGEALSHLRPDGRVLLLISSKMDMARLERLIASSHHRVLGSRRFFYEELSVMELMEKGRS